MKLTKREAKRIFTWMSEGGFKPIKGPGTKLAERLIRGEIALEDFRTGYEGLGPMNKVSAVNWILESNRVDIMLLITRTSITLEAVRIIQEARAAHGQIG